MRALLALPNTPCVELPPVVAGPEIQLTTSHSGMQLPPPLLQQVSLTLAPAASSEHPIAACLLQAPQEYTKGGNCRTAAARAGPETTLKDVILGCAAPSSTGAGAAALDAPHAICPSSSHAPEKHISP
jgi:hypothetical protein